MSRRAENINTTILTHAMNVVRQLNVQSPKQKTKNAWNEAPQLKDDSSVTTHLTVSAQKDESDLLSGKIYAELTAKIEELEAKNKALIQEQTLIKQQVNSMASKTSVASLEKEANRLDNNRKHLAERMTKFSKRHKKNMTEHEKDLNEQD